MSVDLTHPLVLKLSAVETTLEGFLTQTHWPSPPSSSFLSPALLFNLFSLAPTSTKGNTLVWGRHCIVLFWGLVYVSCAFVCMCNLVSDLRVLMAFVGWTNDHSEFMAFFLCVSVASHLSTFRFKPCIVVVVGSGSSSARPIKHAHASVHTLTLIDHWWWCVDHALPVYSGLTARPWV